jgi:hypothetical protein
MESGHSTQCSPVRPRHLGPNVQSTFLSTHPPYVIKSLDEPTQFVT